MTTFYFVRHGQSEGNLHGRFIGQGDAPLTELGRLQAKKTEELLGNVKFDLAFASDLIRAFETGEIVLYKRGLTLIPEPRLREIFAGSWEGLTYSQIEQTHAMAYDVWKHEIGKAHPENGESVLQLYERTTAVVAEIANKNPSSTVLIATHATPIRCVVAKASGLPCERMHEIPWSPNSSVTVIGVEKGKFSVISPSSADHLGDIATFLPKNV